MIFIIFYSTYRLKVREKFQKSKTKTFLFINIKIDITRLCARGAMVLKLKCDICGKPLNASNIGYVLHPQEEGRRPIMRCKECHSKIKEKKRQRTSSYMIIE